MLQKDTNFKRPNYSEILKEDHLNRRSHGGVAIYLHESVRYKEIHLSTLMKAVAVQAFLGFLATVVGIYNSRIHDLTTPILNNFLQQLPKPVILTRDFHSHHQAWGCTSTDTRGNQVFKLIQHNNLNYTSNGRPTKNSGYST